MTIEPASGTNKAFSIYIFKNGVEVAVSRATNKASAGDPKNTSLVWALLMNPEDYIEVWIENNTDTIDLKVNSSQLRVNG